MLVRVRYEASDRMSLWGTRIGWALGGAAVAVAAVWLGGGLGDGARDGAAHDDAAVGEVANVRDQPSDVREPNDARAASTGTIDASGAEPIASTDGGAANHPTGSTSSDGGAEGDGGVEGIDGVAAAEPSDAPTDATDNDVAIDDLDGLPDVPLPQMPGTRFMQRFRKPNDEGGGWEVSLTISVPAPGSQVESFYAAALRDAGVKVRVRTGEAAGAISDGYRGTLRGRGAGTWAQVNVHQRPNRVRTVVRIVWRTGQ